MTPTSKHSTDGGDELPPWREEHWICKVDGCEFHHVGHGAATQHLIDRHPDFLSEYGKQRLLRKGQDW